MPAPIVPPPTTTILLTAAVFTPRTSGDPPTAVRTCGAMDDAGWRVAASSYVLDSPYLRIRRDRIVLPDGTVIEDYYVRESRGYVIVFALTEDRRVVLVRQYKHGAAKVLLELIAGAIDEGEQPLQTAIRELAEETGYGARSMEHLRSFVTDPTNADTIAHLFFAKDAYPNGEQQLDVTEDIAVELATLDELREKLRSGEIDSMPHVGAMYFVLDHLGSLTGPP
ncbi:MAG TPA: NUDIX hydrolase [Candidatus Baltobacteraceae bacterium]|nr:NUDIX hydrolase [Candidatus Baltobacteraceae bacterium]